MDIVLAPVDALLVVAMWWSELAAELVVAAPLDLDMLAVMVAIELAVVAEFVTSARLGPRFWWWSPNSSRWRCRWSPSSSLERQER